ncbi:hypothetical protein B1L04_02900 [Microcystis aeruginosa KW]|uniref:Activator of Hsp90 ATPase homologue 1/2-like C-terminal domain-containing protein n=1 Tax=Microcystis aeruginosa KW TaxID=1960155 RepID=A0A1V4BYD5_MICAE|nr:SRPBCC domain-containing protein [Microcystis aeruginosa]OPF19748.1 hypothetical protein B1L04_02900 [Microcystis aeruginosa KW]
MSETSIGSTSGTGSTDHRASPSTDGWKTFSSLETAETTLPRLGVWGGRSLQRDRWERLVTSHDMPASPETVWQALSDPAALKLWLGTCHGLPDQLHKEYILDFEDGEFFLCCPVEVRAPFYLRYLWRWLGIGPATSVTWQLEAQENQTRVTVIEEACNPPRDWQAWHGDGWPGILDQLAAYLRTGLEWRWPWRRMGPYAVVELAVPVYEAWNRLFSSAGLRAWLFTMQGNLTPQQSLTILMGDASGMVEMLVQEVVQPGQSPPSFLPYVNFTLRRHAWQGEVGGRLWLEPAGWERSLLQVFHYNWENLTPGLQLSERKLLASFWANAMRRANLICTGPTLPTMMPT